MESFKELINKFDFTLRKYNPVNYKKLQVSLTNREIDLYLNKLQIENGYFKNLFEWKNGFDLKKSLHSPLEIFDFGALLPLETILNFEVNNSWNLKLVPLISSGDGDYILYNKENGQLHLFSAALLLIDEPISYYDSIYTMIKSTIKAYEIKVFNFNKKNNWLDVNFGEFHKIASELNPKSQYWKLD